MLTRHELESLAERLIERLDIVDGDPDLEEDDPSGQNDEDERNTGSAWFAGFQGPGCPFGDPGEF